MRKVAFLEMLARGQHSEKDSVLYNSKRQPIPPYPFADLLAPVGSYTNEAVNKSKGSKYSFPDLPKVGAKATIAKIGAFMDRTRPSYLIYRWYQHRKIIVSVESKDGFYIITRKK